MNQRESANVKLSVRERLSFATGDFAYNCVFYWVSAYLMIFYTDVFLIPAAAVSILMLVVRLYDAVNDPIIGSLADRTNTKLGRYRPWILIGGLGLCIACIFMFWAHPTWSENAKMVYMYVTYIVVVTFSTMFYMSYMAMTGCISTDALERTQTASWRMVAQYGGMLLVGYAAPYMIAYFGSEDITQGYLKSVIICAVIAAPFFVLTVAGGKERVIRQVETKQKMPIKQQFSVLWRNKAMLILIICMTAHGIQMNARLTIATYYCTYVGTGMAVFAVFNLLNSLSSIVGCMVTPVLYQKTGNKGRSSVVILILCALSMGALYFVEVPSAAFYILTVITGLCYGSFSALMFSMIPDAVDYTHAEDGLRLDGFFNAIASFGFKCGGAVGTAVIGAALSASGYIANQVQTAECIRTIRLLMSFLPAAFCVIAAVCLLKYQIDRNKHEEILEKLKAEDVLI